MMSLSDRTNDKYSVLEKVFGYKSFRNGQEQIIDAILNKRDALAIMPTGAGKSICFQVPAMLMRGITLVICPLISLMKDQVASLIESGIPAAYLNSSLTYRQYLKALENAKYGKYKIIYVAPERLCTPEFQSFAEEAEISMVSVDEAHCVSQWGKDFRPSYLRIADFVETLKQRPVISAFTATATDKVRSDIVKILRLNSPVTVVTSFDRKNLYYEIQQPKDKYAALERYVLKNTDKSGIIYCATRKLTEEVCEKLCNSGIAATRYHAGLDDFERVKNQDDFIFDRKPVMVATNAFGMGIDKSNVSYVIHYNMPKNLECYYQEAGRAGRDGSKADCILLYSKKDVVLNEFLIEKSSFNEDVSDEDIERIKENDRRLLKQMTFYATTSGCLREFILKYFGEKSADYCGNCSNCNDFDTVEITEEAKIVINCVKSVGGRYGISMVINLLRGSCNERIKKLGLDNIAEYGLLKKSSERKLHYIVNYLVANGYLEITKGEYPVLTTGEIPINPDVRISMRIPKDVPKEKILAKSRKSTSAGDADLELLSELKALRLKIAKSQSVPAFVVFTDAVLNEMAYLKPSDSTEMMKISGIGLRKMEKYGNVFLEIINKRK